MASVLMTLGGSFVPDLDAAQGEREPPIEDVREFARQAIRDGKMADAESALELKIPVELSVVDRRSLLADELCLLALELGDGDARGRAQDAVRRGWELAPLPQGKPGGMLAAKPAAARWHLAGMIQWKVFGDLIAARAAFAKAVEIDEESQSEAQNLINYFDALEREAAIKAETNRREREKGGRP